MNILNDAVIYLAGPIDRVADDGRTWREEFVQKVKELNITCFDPTNKPKQYMSETRVEKFTANILKESGQFDKLTEYVKTLRRIDLRLVDLADCVVAYIDVDVHLCGTYDEIFSAEDQKKPVLLIVKGGIQNTPNWLFAVVRHSEIFESVDECIEYLRQINNNDIPIDSRWVLVRDYLHNGVNNV